MEPTSSFPQQSSEKKCWSDLKFLRPKKADVDSRYSKLKEYWRKGENSPRVLAIVGNWTSKPAWTAVFPAIAMVFGLIVLFGPKPHKIQTTALEKREGKWLSDDFKKALTYSTVYILALMGLIDSWCQQIYNAMMPDLYSSDPPVGLGLGAMGSEKLTLASFLMMASTLVAPVFTENIFKGKPDPWGDRGNSIVIHSLR